MTGEYESRLVKQRGRIEAQEERIKRQWEAAKERRKNAIRRGEAITGIDKLERRKLGSQSRRDGKWARRKKKLDARRKK